VLPPWIAVPVGIITLAAAALAEAFGLSLGDAKGSQGTANGGVAIVAGLIAGLLVVWWATGLVLEEPFVLQRRDRAWLAVVGAALALVAAIAGIKAASDYLGVAIVLPLGAGWGILLGRASERTMG